MKHLLTFGLLALFVLAAKSMTAQPTANTKTKGPNTKSAASNIAMKGAYAMTRQVLTDGARDSAMRSEQLKIYTDRYMMYVHPNANDSLAGYGIATYEIRNGKVIESVFRTNSGPVENDYELSIRKTGNGYRQTIEFPPNQGRRSLLVEDYEKVGKSTTTPLDGAWKQTRVTYTASNGQTHTDSNPVQFKMYESGYFMWVNTVVDTVSLMPVTHYGYGTFTMDGSNKATEVNTSSSFRTALVGKPVSIQLEFMGPDAYRQTLVNADGSKLVEEYQRMK